MPTQLILSKEQLAQIALHSERSYPNEGCGILLGSIEGGRKVVAEVLPTGNAGEEQARHNRYVIPPEELLQGELFAEQRGLEVIGYFHSHPDHAASPSETDREQAWPRYSYLITSVQEGKATETCCWQLREDRTGFDQETLVLKDPDKPTPRA
jgi:proteasome lid subunit RPN8/RPN11